MIKYTDYISVKKDGKTYTPVNTFVGEQGKEQVKVIYKGSDGAYYASADGVNFDNISSIEQIKITRPTAPTQLEPNKHYWFLVGVNDVLSISLKGSVIQGDIMEEFSGTFENNQSSAVNITWPTNVKWSSTPPTSVAPHKTIQFSILHMVGLWVEVDN